MYLLILCFIASFIPPVREYFKKVLHMFLILIGAILLVINLVMDFFVFPRLMSLYKQSQIPLNIQSLEIGLGVGFVLSLFLLIVGLKFKNILKNNLTFYFMFALMIISIYVVIALNIFSIISPIYKLTASY